LARTGGLGAALLQDGGSTGRSRRGPARQRLAGRSLTVRADLHSIHLLMDGHVLRNVAPGLVPQDLTYLVMRGARQAGPEPAKAAIQRT
jgi:hypothetical protein